MLPNAGTDSKLHFSSTIHRLASPHCDINCTHIADEGTQLSNKLNSIFPLHKNVGFNCWCNNPEQRRGADSIAALEIVPTHLKQVQDCMDLCQRFIHTHAQMTASILPIIEQCTHILKHTCIQYVYYFAQRQPRLSEVPSGLGWLMMPIERQIIWVPLSNKDVNHSSLC